MKFGTVEKGTTSQKLIQDTDVTCPVVTGSGASCNRSVKPVSHLERCDKRIAAKIRTL